MHLFLTMLLAVAAHADIKRINAVAAASIDTAKLASDSVTTAKIINAAVDTAKLDSDAVTTAKILNGAVNTAKIAADAVGPTQLLSSESSCTKVSGGDVVCSGGNVGIGTSSPCSTCTLHVNGGSTGGFSLRSAVTTPITVQKTASGGNIADFQNTVNNGAIRVLDNNGANIVVGKNSGSVAFVASGGAYDLGLGTNNGTDAVYVAHSAQTVGIKTTTMCSTCTLAVNGAIWTNGMVTQGNQKSCTLGLTSDAAGGISGCVSSDRSLKTAIVPFKGISIDELKPVLYRWKDKNRDDRSHAGFVAQDVEKVLPEAVVSAGTGLKGVDSNAVLAAVVSELQMLRARVRKLEK